MNFTDLLLDAISDRMRCLRAIVGPPSIDILRHDTRSLDHEIRVKLAKAGSICVVIGIPEVNPTDVQGEDEYSIGIVIYESPILNQDVTGSRITAVDLAREIRAVLSHQWIVSAWGESFMMTPWTPPEPWGALDFKGTSLEELGPRIVYTMTFTSRAFFIPNKPD